MQRLRALDRPGGLGPIDAGLLRAACLIGPLAPRPTMALLRRRVRRETSGVVLPAASRPFARHVERRRAQGFGLNVNLLGEAVLGSDEADRRLRGVLEHIRRPDVDYVSVKASSVCAQLSSLAFDRSVRRVAEALSVLFEAAAAHGVFVNLDMEEYRDLHLTLAAFRTALGSPAVAGIDAGIVLQAYLPDSHAALEELGAWAVDRFRGSGGRTKIRVVKGANLAMERVEAELHGWVAAPYPTKPEVDASYKLLVARALDPVWGGAVRVGVASHNLYDVAWALLVAAARGTEDRLEVEMLEGMAPGQAEAVRRRGTPVRLYAPVVPTEEFDSAVAYLARRLDENSAPDNYLHHLFAGDTSGERDRFSLALSLISGLDSAPRRSQDRRAPVAAVAPSVTNVADTDWTQAANRAWIADALAVVAPEAPRARVDVADVEGAVAVAAASSWRTALAGERSRLLGRAADRLAAQRSALIATMVTDAHKVVAEADVEVSEAVDYARYYAAECEGLDRRRSGHVPLGTVVVTPPWNFPLAIPLGGALAALAAGNAVILKPAPETVRTAVVGAACLWDAGIPRHALQVLACGDDEAGQRLVSHPGVDAVILTGEAATARMFWSWRPGLRLLAETSGKNAIVVTEAADLDLAVSDVVRSAFGHAGQKCSAASLVIVERSVLDAGRFTRKLADATRTLVVGAASDPATDVGPLIREPSAALHRALTELDPGEQWLVPPREIGRRVWTPGIRVGVRPGSWFHQTECFGPVLGVIACDGLDDGVAIQNGTRFGLTGGLESLDPAEMERWLEAVEVGNAYVNRPITGAVVRRQPFGGWKDSAMGPTAKTGGPSYVPALCRWFDSSVDGRARLDDAFASYPAAWALLRRPVDRAGLAAEINVLRHRPRPGVQLWIGADADPLDVELCRLAAATVGTPIRTVTSIVGGAPVRGLGTVTAAVMEEARAAGVTLDDRRPVAEGAVEIPRWVREQAISVTAHRYGRPSNLTRFLLSLEG
ncbi:MAG: bifunctional proline dehydrogenase/L-glutamate gamma-semialdehyde dehydrogenase [Acidimicrobiales bacterium]